MVNQYKKFYKLVKLKIGAHDAVMKTAEKKGGIALPAIAEKLWQLIMETGLKVGDKLPAERKLAEKLNVSRGAIRCGIQSLVERGILCRRHGDGTYISSVSEEEFVKKSMAMAMQVKSDLLTEILEFRRILEPQTAYLAAGRISQQEIDELKVIVCNQQLQTGSTKGDLDAAFHLKLAKCSGNRVLFRVMELINDVLAESRSGEYQNEMRKDTSISGHLRIIDAFEKRNSDAAFQAMREHLEQIERLVMNDTKSNKREERQ